jgi:hypothetical protein
MAEVTKPVFVKGKAYGYSCAKMFMDSPKRVAKANFVKPDSFEVEDRGYELRVVAIIDGKKYRAQCHVSHTGIHSWEQSLSLKKRSNSFKRFTFMEGNKDEIYVNLNAYETYKAWVL